MPFFDGLMTEELDALIGSFAGEPELHHPRTRTDQGGASVRNGPIDELRMHFSGRPLTGRHANRPPLLQPDPGLRDSGVVAGTNVRCRLATSTQS